MVHRRENEEKYNNEDAIFFNHFNARLKLDENGIYFVVKLDLIDAMIAFL